MTDYFLKITLQSPLSSAVGLGRVGLVDRDVVYDDLGLPILPGKRLKGLWREAYSDVYDAQQLCGQEFIPVEDVFGKSGQKSGGNDISIHVANAKLQEESLLNPWLRHLQHPDPGTQEQKLYLEDVLQHFATVREQTAIDRRTGAAAENALRLTRTLKTGWVFYARIYFGPPNQKISPAREFIDALAIGAAALQQMGTGRTRGLGQVSCRLFGPDTTGRRCDLTEEALKRLLCPIVVHKTTRLPRGPVKPQPARLKHKIPTHVLRYRLTLTEPVVIRVAEGDPNTVVTRQDIPGGHILGVVAWHYLRQPKHFPQDSDFCHAFLDGGLRFLTAYPEAADNQQRLIPIPHSIRKFKDDDTLIDFMEELPGERATKRIERHYARIAGNLNTQAVKTERNYHHARAGENAGGRSIGRALGNEVEEGGAFFQYEALKADQSFQGAVLGSEQDLKKLKAWLAGVNTIRLGRSRSAQYGEAKFEWIDPGNPPLDLEESVEWNGFDDEFTQYWGDDNPDEEESAQTLILTTLSPLLTVNDRGHPEARFPECELAEMLKLDVSKLKLSHSYTRTELVGRYYSHLRLPRQQVPAIAAGSVFEFDLRQDLNEVCEERLIELENNGLGLHKGEGYGRIAVNRQSGLNLTRSVENPLDDPAKQTEPPAPKEAMPTNLLRDIAKTRCLAEMRAGAMILDGKNLPSNNQLKQLHLWIQQDAPVDRLEGLRKDASEKLKNCQIIRRVDNEWLPNRKTLYALFKQAWTSPYSLPSSVIEAQAKRLLEEDKAKSLIESFGEEDRKEMCRVFLDHLLTALYRQ